MSPKPLDSTSHVGDIAAQPTSNTPLAAQASKQAKQLSGAGGYNKAFLKSSRGRGKWLVVITLITLVVGAGAYWYWQRSRIQKKAQQAQEQTQGRLAQLDAAKGLSDEEKKALYDKAGMEYAAAVAVGIAPDFNTVNDQNQLTYLAQLSRGGSDGVSKALKTIIDQRLQQVQGDGYYEGYVYKYWYGNTVVTWPANYQVNNRGDATALATDKQYALDALHADKQRLERQQIAPTALVTEVSSNERLHMYEDPNGSYAFVSQPTGAQPGIPDSAQTQGSKNIQTTIAGMKRVGMSDSGGLTYTSIYDTKHNEIEAGYYFVQITKYLQGQAIVDQYTAILKQLQKGKS